MFFVRAERGMDVIFEFNTDLFDQGEITAMFEDCHSLLIRLAAGSLELRPASAGL
jgi:hypothetical protein